MSFTYNLNNGLYVFILRLDLTDVAITGTKIKNKTSLTVNR